MSKRESGAAPLRLRWRIPLIFLVLTFTAVPSKIQRPSILEDPLGALSFQVNERDVAFNIAGYLPVGVALADLPVLKGTAAAVLLSAVAETAQLFTNDRFPSPVDVISNALGALIGLGICRRRRFTDIALTKTRGSLAGLGAACLLMITATATWIASGKDIVSGPERSSRPIASSTPAPIEPAEDGLVAHWTFDDVQGDALTDTSSNRLFGSLVNGASLVPGVYGSALMLDGHRQYVDLGSPEALQLGASMSVSAWINASSFPRDDAVILSNRDSGGFQLDVTADVGFRTIKFLVGDGAGNSVIRYGRTILQPRTWYHVAGVFDAASKTLDVYVNGSLDDGCLVGTVGSAQEPATGVGYIGRRPDQNGYEYAGALDDLRVYSRALSEAEIEWLSRAHHDGLGLSSDAQQQQANLSCQVLASSLDWGTIASSGLFGVLLTLAFFGIRQRIGGRTIVLLLSAAGGLVISHASRAVLPQYDQWIVPALAVAGSASVLLGVRARRGASSI